MNFNDMMIELYNGKTISHRYFYFMEYIKIDLTDRNFIFDEKGYRFLVSTFFHDRKYFSDDWFIVEQMPGVQL